MSVPITTLTMATTIAATTVNRRAAHASGARTACQNAPRPRSLDRHTTAPSGMSTIRLR